MSERNHVAKPRHQVLRAMIEERRRDVQEKLRSLRESLPAHTSDVLDTEEQSVQDFVQDVELALMEMQSATLGQIDEAIRRLEAGTYGACADCGAEIAAARLKALPFASLCLGCQEGEEETRAAGRLQDTRALGSFAALAAVKAEGEP